jgi:hypothetical protein
MICTSSTGSNRLDHLSVESDAERALSIRRACVGRWRSSPAGTCRSSHDAPAFRLRGTPSRRNAVPACSPMSYNVFDVGMRQLRDGAGFAVKAFAELWIGGE